MAYTLTIDASVKIRRDGSGRGSARGLIRHIFRDIEPPQTHSNKNIDTARTQNNESYIYDEDANGYRAAVSGDEIMQKWNERLAEVGRKSRDSDVIARPLVFNLDPNWIAEHDPDWKENGLSDEHRRLTNAMIEWVSARMGGKQNCVAYSIHMDESIPQVQMIMVPVYESEKTGKILLSQKHFFPSPTALKKLHQDFRAHMRAAGYDASASVSPRSREHLTSSDFQRKADKVKADAYTLTERGHALDDRANTLAKGEMRLHRRERVIAEKEKLADDTIAAAHKKVLAMAEQAKARATDIISAAQMRATKMQEERNAELEKRAAALDRRAAELATQQATANDVTVQAERLLSALDEKIDEKSRPIVHAKKMVDFMQKRHPETLNHMLSDYLTEQRRIADAAAARRNAQRNRLRRSTPDTSYGL